MRKTAIEGIGSFQGGSYDEVSVEGIGKLKGGYGSEKYSSGRPFQRQRSHNGRHFFLQWHGQNVQKHKGQEFGNRRVILGKPGKGGSGVYSL